MTGFDKKPSLLVCMPRPPGSLVNCPEHSICKSICQGNVHEKVRTRTTSVQDAVHKRRNCQEEREHVYACLRYQGKNVQRCVQVNPLFFLLFLRFSQS